MRFKNIILCLALAACHSTPPVEAPTANVTPTEEARAPQKKLGTVTVKSLGCPLHSEKDVLYWEYFGAENATLFGNTVCDGVMPNVDQDCFDLFAQTFVMLTRATYENGDAELAADAFVACGNTEPKIGCFLEYEMTLLTTHNQVCEAANQK